MKLVATIPPRRDGTVILTTADARITFAPNEHGELVGEVADEALVARLLHQGGFEPFDEADFERASALLDAAERLGKAGSTAEGGDDDDDDDGQAADAPPVEAKTPPKAAARPKPPTAKTKRASGASAH